MNSSTPPPLDFQPANYESPAKALMAAKVAMAAPAVMFLFNLAFGTAKRSFPEGVPHAVVLVQEGVCLLLISVGLIAAIYALVSVRKFGSRGILGRGIGGLLLNGFFLFIFVTNFSAARQNRLQARQEMDQLESALGDMRADMRKEMEETGTLASDDAHIKRIESQFTKASEKLSGSQKALMEAGAAFAQAMQLELKKYNEALEDFQAADAFNGEGITSKEQIAKKRTAVEKFMKVNQSFTAYLSDLPKVFEKELRSRNISEAEVNQAMKGFMAQNRRQSPLMKEIRACDDRVGKAALGVLSLLDTQFGKWKYDTAQQQIVFPDDKSIEEFNGFLDEVHKAAEDQTAAQQKMLALEK
ncbi:MAG TPA: hypothetical protein VGH19_08670 [Verrucomicrobiae bacterium]